MHLPVKHIPREWETIFSIFYPALPESPSPQKKSKENKPKKCGTHSYPTEPTSVFRLLTDEIEEDQLLFIEDIIAYLASIIPFSLVFPITHLPT